ncbi:MAG: SDR family oxidoreductase [Rhizobiaceae bacterium]|nr:SDR family oxidoreductase [Rhizobiaceae bacterium]
MRHADKVAIVTGAAQGIGLAIAKKLSQEGASVVLADIDAERGRAEAGGIERAIFHRCDVGDAAEAAGLVDKAVAEFGRLDFCVNNAAIVPAGDIFEIEDDRFDQALRTNLRGPFLVSRAAARVMVANGAGSIVNMSSVSASFASPKMIAYGMSKAGVNMLTRALALTLAPYGIRVNAVAPGTVNTAQAALLMTDPASAEMVLSRTPIGRLAETAEIAEVVAFLLSEQASYITGQTIVADGGRTVMNFTMPKRS